MQSWIPWIWIGLASSALHLALLSRALTRVRRRSAEQAQRAVMRGVPLRLMALGPILYLAARCGLWACVGWVGGFIAARLVVGVWVLNREARAAREGRMA